MHIVVLSDTESFGGAAIGTSRLSDALIHAGVEVTRIVYRPDGRAHAWSTHVVGGPKPLRTLAKAGQRVTKQISFDLAVKLQAVTTDRAVARLLRRLKPDAISVNNLHAAGWWPTIVAECSSEAPTAWTLRDMWSFTGRCAYSDACQLFETGCDASCPTPSEHPALEPRHIASAWRLRRDILERNPEVVAVTPSRWLAREAVRGVWRGHRVEIIPNALPLDVYKPPTDRKSAREAIGVPADVTVAIIAAQDFRERRKGAELLIAALERIDKPLTVVVLGQGTIPVRASNITVVPLGHIADDESKVQAYAAADFLIHPATADNLPHVVLEAMACGTPGVAFAIGGVPDMIRPGITGWLAEDISVDGLTGAIRRAIDDMREGITLRESSRTTATAEYGLPRQAADYLALFESMITARTADQRE